jgi:homocitrate synthase
MRNKNRVLTQTKVPFYLVDTTLREGEQFASCEFSPEDRVYIAKQLDRLGVDFIELVNPVASEQALKDCTKISALGLQAKVLTHIRCHMTDASVAVKSGVQGVNVYMATSPILSQHSHGKGIETVISSAREVIEYVKKHKLEIRFSCEDAFRSKVDDILLIYQKVDEIGVDRVGIADTVGIATPDQVYDVVKKVRSVIKPTTGIEFHTHNDTGCCIANAYMALLAGATHIDTCVLGIGERNGITPLGGFLGRMYTVDKDHVKQRFDLNVLTHLERYVSRASGINIPFNNYITGSCAFTHKAGVHSKAVMANPNAYEVIDPADFGVIRNIQFAHRLTGWNAIYHRSKQLGLDLSDDQVKAATSLLKNLADERNISLEQVDNVLLELAAIPQTSSSRLTSFVKEKKNLSPELEAAAQAAADAMAAFEREAARLAVHKIQEASDAKIKGQPSCALKLEGHLFDTRCINEIIDVLVDSPCKFEISGLEVPPKNEMQSTAYLRVWSEKQKDLETAKEALRSLVEESYKNSCRLSVISYDQIPKK